MKTTVEIPAALLNAARRAASRDGVTVRALLIEGLHRVLESRKRDPAFHLRDASFNGEAAARGGRRLVGADARPGSRWRRVSTVEQQVLGIGHGIDELWTADRDFSRFLAVRVRNPLIPPGA